MYQDDGSYGGSDYVHVDVSDQFSMFAKFVVALVWLVSFIVINYYYGEVVVDDKKTLRTTSWKIALTSAIVMVWIRHLLQMIGHGPPLGNIDHQIFVEPAIFFASGSLLQASLLLRQKKSKEVVSFFVDTDDQNRSSSSSSFQNYYWKQSLKTILISIASSISITEDAATSLFMESYHNNKIDDESSSSISYDHHLFCCWKIGTCIAGLLSYTSNFATFVVVLVAYDVIYWREYVLNLLMVAILLFLMSLLLLCVTRRGLLLPGNSTNNETRNSHNVGYMLTRKEDDDNDDDEGIVEDDSYLGQYDLELTIKSNSNGITTTTASKGGISNDDVMNNVYKETAQETMKTHENDDNDPLVMLESPPASSHSLHDDDDHHHQHSWCLLFGLPFIGLPIAFFICNGQNILWIALTFAILMTWITGCFARGSQQEQQQQRPSSTGDGVDSNSNTFWNYIDLKPLLLYLSWCILTGSLVDTGVPQSFVNVAMGKCADQMTSSACIYKFTFVVYTMSICFSPLVTAIVLFGTFPYATPYDWIQVIVAMSAGKFVRSLWNLMTQRTTGGRHGGGDPNVAEGGLATTGGRRPIIVWRICVVLSSLFVLWAGTAFVQTFHTVYECSVRLGECGMGWGGWKK